MSAVVDGEVVGRALGEFEEHIGRCRSCRVGLELEKITKRTVTKHLQPVAAPQSIVDAILNSIASAQAMRRGQKGRNWHIPVLHTFRPVVLIPAAAALVLAVAAIILFRPEVLRIGRGKASADVLTAAIRNYDSLRLGTAPLEFVSRDPDSVKDFLRGKVDFRANVPILDSYHLVGAGVTSYCGVQCAEVLYRRDMVFVYMLQMNRLEVCRSSTEAVPLPVTASIDRGEWYLGNNGDSSGVVVWVNGEILCFAVAGMDEKVLSSLLSGW